VSAAAAAAILLALSGVARGAAGADGGAPANPGARATGVLCLRRLPPPIDFRDERKGNSGPLDQNSQEEAARKMATHPRLEVSVDNAAVVTVDQKAGACIDGLALDAKHVVRSIRPGVSRQWGRFTFEPGQPVLELRYDPFYGNVHVETPPWLAAKAAGMSSCAACALAPAARKKQEPGSLIPDRRPDPDGRQRPPRRSLPVTRRRENP
jgi:hypothetical protein